MQSKEERVHNVFEKIYDNYDKMNTIISFQQHIKWRNATMKKCPFQKAIKHLIYVVVQVIGRLLSLKVLVMMGKWLA